VTVRLVACGGLDSSGGAGLDADRDAARALGADLVEVVTCRTEQDDTGVDAVEPLEGWWRGVGQGDALKFGLLPGPEHILAAAHLVRTVSVPAVVDPVIAASSGHVFLDEAGLVELRRALLAAGPVVTPNLPEAEALTGERDPEAAATRLLELGAAGVVVKGGHGEGPTVRELVLMPGASPRWLEHPRHPGRLRGTGCRFATALAVELARGACLETACERASALVAARIQGA